MPWFPLPRLLKVTPRKVANLELLLTQDKAPRHKALSGLEDDSWACRMRYFKVGWRWGRWCAAGA